MAVIGIAFLLVLQGQNLGFSSVSAAIQFTTEPSDLTREVGGNATFRCSTQPCKRLIWVVSGAADCTRAGSDTGKVCTKTVYRAPVEKDKVSFSSYNCVYELNIKNVQPEDSGEYVCTGFSSPPAFSRRAVLTVTPPSTPICSSRPENPGVRETLYLACKVPSNATAQSKLSWYATTRNQQPRLLQESRFTPPGSNSTIRHFLQEQDNFLSFTCVAGPGLPGPNCTVVPMQVPVGYVRVNVVKHSRNEDGELLLEFECYSDALPPMTNYIWTVRSNIESLANLSAGHAAWVRGNSTPESGRILRISDVVSHGNWLIITCFGSNEIGLNGTSDPFTVFNCSNDSVLANSGYCNIDVDLTVSYLLVMLAVIFTIVVSALSLKLAKKLRSRSSNSPSRSEQDVAGAPLPTPPPDRGRGLQRYMTVPGYMTVGDPRLVSSGPPDTRRREADDSEGGLLASGPARHALPAINTDANTRHSPQLPVYARPNKPVNRQSPCTKTQPYAVISL